MRFIDTEPLRRDDLSLSELRLIEIMSSMNYGRVEQFRVRNGRPVLEPQPGIEISDKVDCQEAQMPRLWYGRLLNPRFARVIRLIRDLGSGTVTSIDMQGGLPFRILRRPDRVS